MAANELDGHRPALERTLRSGFSAESLVQPKSTFQSAFHPARISVLPATVLPYLQRLDIGGNSHQTHHKRPLLSLRLSSPCFLDSVLNDDSNSHPLYTIQTQGTETSIMRSDPFDGESSQCAQVRWPKDIPPKPKDREPEGVLVRIRGGRWKSASTMLKPATFPKSSRKFHIPGYSRPLKWKLVGSSYWCVASSVKGPIATFAPGSGTKPSELQIFETLHDKTESRALNVYQEVSVLLLDYLVITIMLLVTQIQDWMVVKKYEGEAITTPTTPPSSSESTFDKLPRYAHDSATAWQLRKIIYGEPLFPRRTSSSINLKASSKFPPTPTSGSFRSSASLTGSDTEEEEDDDDDENEEDVRLVEEVTKTSLPAKAPPSRPPSPSAESVCYPLTPSAAPHHTYLDPLFYDAPPVPSIPAQYASSSTSSPIQAPSSPPNTSRRLRELPRPPPRSQSTPPQEVPPPLTRQRSDTVSSLPGRRQSMSQRVRRQLPTPPSLSNTPSALAEKRRSQRSLPPTPTTSRPGSDSGTRHYRKDRWLPIREALPPISPDPRQSVFEIPPPAYNSINFGVPGSSSEVPPVPPLPPPHFQ